jgi:hypothetical protein
VTDDGAGLPLDERSWVVAQGGTGFAPPYAFPNPNAGMSLLKDEGTSASIIVSDEDAARRLQLQPATANKYLQNFTARQDPPATIFCSRELEKGLIDFSLERTAMTGQIPGDEEIRARAREILGVQSTAADDAVLLAKFRDMVRDKIITMTSEQQAANEAAAAASVPTTMAAPGAVSSAAAFSGLTAIPNVAISNSELDDILLGMELDLGPATAL